MAIGISGVIADARILCRYMRNECLNHRYTFESGMDTGRLVVQVADKAQRFTQRDEKRPYGVGLLVIGYDQTGPHLYETSPSVGLHSLCLFAFHFLLPVVDLLL